MKVSLTREQEEGEDHLELAWEEDVVEKQLVEELFEVEQNWLVVVGCS